MQYTAATTPWLTDLYACAGNDIVDAELRSADFLDLQSADLVMRIGQPSSLTSPAYQIGNEDIVVIINRGNMLRSLTVEQVRGLFSGQTTNWQGIGGSDAPVQVWTFSSGEDVQQIFGQTILNGSPVTSSARLATGPQGMAQAVAEDVNSVGILTDHWMTDDVVAARTIVTAPVLAITPPNASATVDNIVACMQK